MIRKEDHEELQMGWLALRILNMVVSKEIEIPKDITEIHKNHPVVVDIGFTVAHFWSGEEIVDFFNKLEDHHNPFFSDNDYQDYVREGMERQLDDYIENRLQSEDGEELF